MPLARVDATSAAQRAERGVFRFVDLEEAIQVQQLERTARRRRKRDESQAAALRRGALRQHHERADAARREERHRGQIQYEVRARTAGCEALLDELRRRLRVDAPRDANDYRRAASAGRSDRK